ncbi:hypothetical protein V6S67_16920 [Arthrobacter sp. Soc17.1.1.1]|uniref:hypothetical protein n=1 Tax=Arthrobacter sp. Soc17.1.1.1 TaxID=3121277 RepID=UPI002FE46360
MTLIDSTIRTSPSGLRPASRNHFIPASLGGSYVTTARTTTRNHITAGTYTSCPAASAAPGGYVTTEAPSPVTGGSYTYTGRRP